MIRPPKKHTQSADYKNQIAVMLDGIRKVRGKATPPPPLSALAQLEQAINDMRLQESAQAVITIKPIPN